MKKEIDCISEFENYKSSFNKLTFEIYTPVEYMQFDSKVEKIESEKFQIIESEKRININSWKGLNDKEKEFIFFSGYDIYEVYNFKKKV